MAGGLVSPAAAQSEQAGPSTYTALQQLQADLRTDRQALVAENLPLSEAEARAFWPVYKAYATDLGQAGERKANIISAYASNLDSMTDAKAGAFMKDYLSMEGDRLKTRKKYADQAAKVIGAQKAARWMQIETKLDAIINIGIARIDAAGSLTTKFLVPLPPLVGNAATVGNLVWTTDPESLRKMNEERAKELGVAPDAAKTFFLNNRLTLTMQTRVLAALHTVKAANSADYIATITAASSEREAMFFVHSTEMLQQLHAATPVKAILTDSRALVAVTTAGDGVALLPVDWLRETTSAVATMTEAAARAKSELGATSLRIETEATVTERAQAAFERAGWTSK